MKICTIIIYDEVNCKLQNLDIDLRKRLVRKFSYEVPHARFTPAFKLGRWNGKVAFFQLGGGTYINLLDEIIPELVAANYTIQIDDRRTYRTSFTFTEVDKNSLANHNWPDGHRFENQPIILNDHQVDITNDFLRNPQCLIEAATGSGKSIITALLSLKTEQYGRSLVIVPSKSLVVQTEEDYKNLKLDTGVFYGDRREYTSTHTICTWQSLNSLFKNTKDGSAQIPFADFVDGVVTVICDEAHNIKGDALRGMLSGPLAHIPLRWGLTGTIPKLPYEFKPLQVCIGNVVGKVPAAELQKSGHLAQCQIHIKQLQDNMVHGDYQTELTWLLSDGDRLDILAEMIGNIAVNGNTMVLVNRVAAASALALRLPPDKVVVVTGKLDVKKRKIEYDAIETTMDKIIIATYGVAAVGINIPKLHNVVLIEAGKSFVRVIQSIGRGLRVADGKTHVDIHDFTSTCRFARRHLTERKKFYREAGYPFTVEKIQWKK